MIVASASRQQLPCSRAILAIVRPDWKEHGRQYEGACSFRQCRDDKHHANQHGDRVASGMDPACEKNRQEQKHAERRFQQRESTEEKSECIGGNEKCSERSEGLRLILARDRIRQKNTQANAYDRQCSCRDDADSGEVKK